jgi:hypothetical protein
MDEVQRSYSKKLRTSLHNQQKFFGIDITTQTKKAA